MLDINWKNFDIAEGLIGQKALLLGGGGIMNAITVVDVLGSMRTSGQMLVRTDSGTMTPYIMSWYLRPLRDDLQDLELGDYIVGMSNGEIRKQDAGIYGTIYDMTLVKKLNDKEMYISV